jgi:hypothetical protein
MTKPRLDPEKVAVAAGWRQCTQEEYAERAGFRAIGPGTCFINVNDGKGSFACELTGRPAWVCLCAIIGLKWK